MPRSARSARGGVVYHVLNRGNGRARLFHKPADYDAFLKILAEGKARASVELFAFCLMPNHWHLLLRPRRDADLSRYLAWVSNTHVRRHHEHHHSVGGGHVYQGRYKSFPVQTDEHLLTVLRYVEANAKRAGLATRAEAWRWGSAWARANGDAATAARQPFLDEWPVPRPRTWTSLLNEPIPDAKAAHVRSSIVRGSPFGDEAWTRQTARQLALDHTLRPRGRPRKPPDKADTPLRRAAPHRN